MCSPRAEAPRLGRVQAWELQNLRKLQKLQTGLAEVAYPTDLPVTDTHQNIPFAAKSNAGSHCHLSPLPDS